MHFKKNNHTYYLYVFTYMCVCAVQHSINPIHEKKSIWSQYDGIYMFIYLYVCIYIHAHTPSNQYDGVYIHIYAYIYIICLSICMHVYTVYT